MKKNLVLFVLCCTMHVVFSQPRIRVYAFEQANLPGIVPSARDENGKAIEKAAATTNYFIYLSFDQRYRVRALSVVIRGKNYAVESSKPASAPVVKMNNTIPGKSKQMVLVPRTNDKVVELQLTSATSEEKRGPRMRDLAATNDVVVAYSWKGKKYFVVRKKLKMLEPVTHE